LWWSQVHQTKLISLKAFFMLSFFVAKVDCSLLKLEEENSEYFN